MYEQARWLRKPNVVWLLVSGFLLFGAQNTNAEITPNVAVYEVGPLQETGQQYVTYRLAVILSGADDWTSAEMTATVTDATFYQDPNGDGDPPDPAGFAAFPDSEVTSYYTSPADYPTTAYSGAVVGFHSGPAETATSLTAHWFDSSATGDGTFVIGQITVLPDTPFWTGQVDVTVYSANNPVGVTNSWTISSADYQPPVTATYTGPATGTYNDPFNWDIGLVPLNTVLDRYNVIIPDGQTISFDAPGVSEINGLSLGTDTTLSFLAGESVNVRGTALITGIINATGAGAGFLAPSRFATFGGTRSRISASAGATVRIAAPSYSLNLGDYRASIDILSADGLGSLLDLSSLDSISVPIDPWGSYTYSIAATNNGTIDLRNVTSIAGAGPGCDGGHCDWLRFFVAADGDIDLRSLRAITGWTWFDVDVPTYTLPLLENATTTHIDATDAVTVDLPSLGAFTGGTFTVSNGGTINAPLMQDFTSSTMVINDGGTVNAAALTDVSHSVFNLNPSRVLNAPPFANFDHARIALSGGASLTVAAQSYNFNWGDYRASMDILSADGVGTLLDLSSLDSISVPIDPWGSYTYSIAATNNGTIDLRNVTSIAGAGPGCDGGHCDWLRFFVAADGDIDLRSLRAITGWTWFDVDVPTYTLPLLENATTTHIDATDAVTVDLPSLHTFNGNLELGQGTTLNTPALVSITGGGNGLTIPVFAALEAPTLTDANGLTINLDVGGTINAPSLTSFTGGTFVISQVDQGGPFVNVPPFTNFDHSRLLLDGGATFAVSALSYNFNWGDYRASMDILSADGVGTLLELSSLDSISVPIDPWGSYTYSIAATNNGTIDLRNVTSIAGAGPGCDGGHCDWLMFVANGGDIYFGDVLVSGGRTKFEISGTASAFDFGGGLTLQTPSRLSATLGATINIAGDYNFNHTNEADIDISGAVFRMVGTGTQQLEVGGEDIGMPAGSIAPNFEMGQLVVGQTGQANVVRLVDNVDNGNRGGSGIEALYLPGPTGGDEGLRILGGSTLVIENIPVYAQVLGSWVYINGLFPAGANQIAFDQGFIALSIPENDCNANGIEDRVDVLLVNSLDCDANEVPDECEIDQTSSAPGGPFFCDPAAPPVGLAACDPDCNASGIPDACDITEGTSQDCNENGIPDSCDVGSGSSADINGNGRPDECEDCNQNTIPDFVDLADQTSADCNGNALPDECEIDVSSPAPGGPFFCTAGCDPDCNANGLPDACDIADCLDDPVCSDCQPNGVPDGCDIADGTSVDLDGNARPDECDVDCNHNSIPDSQDIIDCDGSAWCGDCNGNAIPDVCDITNGVVLDGNGNGIPDECEQTPTAVVGEGCRYLGITPAAGALPVALLVEGDQGDARVSCVSGYVQADGTLDNAPFFQLPAAWGAAHVGDQEIMAGATYSVQADFGAPGSPLLSLPVNASTLPWGDMSDDTFVNGYDLLMFVDAYRTDLPYWFGDLCPSVPDGLVNGVDLLCWIDAYLGQPYPFWDCGAQAAGAGDNRASSVTLPVDGAALTLRARRNRVRPGRAVSVEVFLKGTEDVRLYEVAIDVGGGDSGTLVLDHVFINEDRPDFVFSGHSPVSINDTGQQRATSALWEGGESAVGLPRYLATFVFVPSSDASGVFELTLRDDPGTMLRDSLNQPIAISESGTVTIQVGKGRRPSIRNLR